MRPSLVQKYRLMHFQGKQISSFRSVIKSLKAYSVPLCFLKYILISYNHSSFVLLDSKTALNNRGIYLK